MEEKFEGKNETQEKKKGRLTRLADLLKSTFRSFVEMLDFFPTNYKNTKVGSYILVCVWIAIMTAKILYENLSRTAVLAVLLWILIVAVACFVIYVGERLVKFIFRYNFIFFYYWALLFFLLKKGIHIGCLKSVRVPSLIFVAIFSFVVLAFVNGIFTMIVNKNRNLLVCVTTIIFAISSILGFGFLQGEGMASSKVNEYLELVNKGEDSDTLLEDMNSIDGTTMGPYQTLVAEYGVDDLESKEIDLSMYATDASGLAGFYRQKFLNMDIEHAGIHGKVWYPETKNNCPMLFIVHGNHTTNETSFEGYEYLGEYLSSYGYMVISIDENILNTLSGENDARAVFFLEHMDMIHQYILDKTNPLYQKGDFSNIAIAGHSRGGESVALAYLFNELTNYSENGVRKLDYDFNVKSIVAIAPSVNQFMPADHPVEIEDVNYLLLQGANDQDIYGYMGMTQYENVTFSGEKECFKTAFYIANANHGQFNSKWGKYDVQFPYSIWLNVKNLLPEEEQEQIAKTVIKAFLDDTLLGDKTHHDLFTDYQNYTEILPDTIYITQYQPSRETIISDFEEDADLKTGTMENSKVKVHHVGIWAELTEDYSNQGMSKKSRQNHVLKLKWTDKTDPYVEFVFPKMDFENGILSFCIADADLRAVEEEEYELLVCEIRIKDEHGEVASCVTGNYASIFPPIPTKLGKMQYITGDTEYKIALQTIRLPIEEFINDSEEIDLSAIVEIEIHILNRDTGSVFLDKIGIEKIEE